jgi:hypothetical protein
MADKIVGMMWNKNEEDILGFTIPKALEVVDFLVMADDMSTDNSFEVMQSFKGHPKVLHVEQVLPGREKKQVLLDVIKSKFDYEKTLIQVIESDVTILETDIRACWEIYSNNNVAMSWHMINATDPDMWVTEDGCYPTWEVPIDKKMSNGHWMENLSHYTFRALPGVRFLPDSRPRPKGFAQHFTGDRLQIRPDSPLLAHWGYRGPKHWYAKYSKGPGTLHSKHKWRMGTVNEIKEDVLFFNGVWNVKADQFPLSRAGWTKFIKEKWDRGERL